jgi:hypothetical protein
MYFQLFRQGIRRPRWRAAQVQTPSLRSTLPIAFTSKLGPLLWWKQLFAHLLPLTRSDGCSLRDYIGFCLGISAILFWLVAQVGCSSTVVQPATPHRYMLFEGSFLRTILCDSAGDAAGLGRAMYSACAAAAALTCAVRDVLLLRLQIPQYVRNYKTKSAEALSPWFLASWLLVSKAAQQHWQLRCSPLFTAA